jgi:hypothetical protein
LKVLALEENSSAAALVQRARTHDRGSMDDAVKAVLRRYNVVE